MTAALLLAGCKVQPPKPPLCQTLAVLPFDSESNNVDAPDILQRLTYLALVGGPYQVLDYEMVNKKLADAGIQDGGQLPAVDLTKLGKDLGVQGLVLGNVVKFGYTNIGFYSERKVALDLKVVDVATGQTLWENSGTGATRNFATDSKSAEENLAKGLAQKVVDMTMHNPLDEEARLATLSALRTLPGFVSHGFARDAKSQSGAQNSLQHGLKEFIRQK